MALGILQPLEDCPGRAREAGEARLAASRASWLQHTGCRAARVAPLEYARAHSGAASSCGWLSRTAKTACRSMVLKAERCLNVNLKNNSLTGGS